MQGYDRVLMSSHQFEAAGQRKLPRMTEAVDLLTEEPFEPNPAEREIEAMVATYTAIESKTAA